MPLREQFESAIRAAIGASYELGYTPTRFEQMIEASHPVEVGKKLVLSGEMQHGIRELAKLGHLELTIESMMLEERFQPLFTQQELDVARWRLDQVQSVT